MKEAEQAIEAAYLQRFETLRPPEALVLRSDKVLFFQSRSSAGLLGLSAQQEFITPYTPEQSGIIESFLRTLREEFRPSLVQCQAQQTTRVA